MSYLFSEGGRAYFSANCDTISNLDSVLAFAATILGYMMVFPIFYLFSQVIFTLRISLGSLFFKSICGFNARVL